MMEHHGHAGPPGHGGHGDHAARFRDRFWWSLVLSVPVVASSEMVQEWLGFTPPRFPGSQRVAPVLGTAVFLYGGRPFLEGGLAELRSRQPGMMLAANDPRGVLGVLKLSQASYRKMLQNLGWATGDNLLAVPVAAGVLAWAGVTLPRPSVPS